MKEFPVQFAIILLISGFPSTLLAFTKNRSNSYKSNELKLGVSYER